MDDNFDLKNYLRNNLLNESLEEAKETEEVKEEVKTEGYGKMKKSQLKEKIREEILEALKGSDEDDDELTPEELANKHAGSPMHQTPGLEEAEDEDAEIDLDVDTEVDIEEPVSDEGGVDPFGDVEDDVEGAEKEAYEAIIAAGRAYKKLGEDTNNGGFKTMMDQLTYLERSYDYPPKEDVFNTGEGI
tara:strand:+ start:250 stop:813 length:564 start_codon:yes stop_codon:yes gene_type:complete